MELFEDGMDFTQPNFSGKADMSSWELNVQGNGFVS